MKNTIPMAAMVAAGLVLAAPTLMASYTLVDDFESYTLGSLSTGNSSAWINNGGPWYVNGSSTGTSYVQIQDDGGGNQYLAISDGFSGVRAADRTAPTIADGAVGTYYFQILNASAGNDDRWGLSNFAAGSGLNNTGYGEAWVSLRDDGVGGLKLVGENGSGATLDLATGLSINAWYDIWMVIDNATDTYDVYLGTSGDANTLGTLVGNDLNFRHAGSVGDLVTFWSLDNGDPANTAQSGRVDNIYFNPVAVPEPSAALLGGLGLLGLLRRRRV